MAISTTTPVCLSLWILLSVVAHAWQSPKPRQPCWQPLWQRRGSHVTSSLAAASIVSADPTININRIPIQEDYPGLQRIHSDPDIFVVHDFLSSQACQDIIDQATAQDDLAQSPVAYGGWTDDVKDAIELVAKGPAAWLALLSAWYQATHGISDGSDGASTASQLDLIRHALQNYAVILAVSVLGIGLWTQQRAQSLQELRTSTSTTVDPLNEINNNSSNNNNRGSFEFVQKAQDLLQSSPSLFERPTVIRYQAGQSLAPHYDANRSAEKEDLNRGGQTVATLIVYLNDVPNTAGGATRFGLLSSSSPPGSNHANDDDDDDDDRLTVQPQRGDALLFFPASADGEFDTRLEHEGCPAMEEKWIARIWRHTDRVNPPFGLSLKALRQFQ